jgi:hypothetical protein
VLESKKKKWQKKSDRQKNERKTNEIGRKTSAKMRKIDGFCVLRSRDLKEEKPIIDRSPVTLCFSDLRENTTPKKKTSHTTTSEVMYSVFKDAKQLKLKASSLPNTWNCQVNKRESCLQHDPPIPAHTQRIMLSQPRKMAERLSTAWKKQF